MCNCRQGVISLTEGMDQVCEKKQLFAIWKRYRWKQHPKTKVLCYLSVVTVKMKHNFASFQLLCNPLSSWIFLKKTVSADDLKAICKYPMYHAKQVCIDKIVLGLAVARLNIWKERAKMQASN